MSDEPGYSAYGVLSLLLAHARSFALVPILTGALAVAATFALGRSWYAESTFAPQESAEAGRLVGLASQLGMNIPGLSEPNASIDFYVRLAAARVLLEDVVLSDYAFAERPEGSDTLRGNLITLYDIQGDTHAKRLRAAAEHLRSQLNVSGDLNAGVVTITTEAPWAALSEQINRRLLDGIDDFNQQRRQAQAAAERAFLQERLTEARAELAQTESALSAFLESNRQWETWPQLRFEKDRLQRSLDAAQQLVLALVQSHEQAKLEEVRNTPVISVLDPPEGSARRTDSVVGNFIWGAAAGALLVLLLAFGREYASRERRENPQDYEEFAARRRSLLRINGSERKQA